VSEEERELAEQLAEELRRLKVEDVLVQTLMTVSSIGYRRLGLTEDTKEDRDLEQARLAIESLRALEPVLRESGVDEAIVRDLEQARTNLQLAYAKAVAVPKEDASE
jgi:hypothetical protein